MTVEAEVLKAEREFFDALLAGSGPGLDRILADDFQLIDVMTGSEIPRAVLIDLVGSGQLKFLDVNLVESRVRSYDKTAIVTGRTRMTGSYGDQ
ncbi:MAG: nuclear transport factor 2 family protein, partial [Gemmatimonadota bacterium]